MPCGLTKHFLQKLINMAEKYLGPERRKFKRVNVNFTLIYRVDASLSAQIAIEGNTDIDVLMLDLSQVGLALLTNYSIPQETDMLLKFTLINSSAGIERRTVKLDMVGKVVSNIKIREGEYRIGINFTQITQEDKDAIAEFVRNK